ncbi:hypothetical protein [Cohnella terricola]|uniref:Uncharacterized protein n=1 Tax=Cohnella terricola TaxID=1289167 RepID=A0A559JII6_9BACL|nr:hypothetical protein [Cohnella terricola]TVX99685.1 hypothetical protein FPZ45_12055 [Cohnella terricola]
MKKKTGLIISFALVAVIVAVAVLWHSKQNPNAATVNEKIVQVESFHVSADTAHLQTLAEGTVFVYGNEATAERIQIVARIEVDPADWGGVAFYVPLGWRVSDIVSDYPENTEAKPADYVSTWTTASADSRWRAMIEVARDRSYTPIGGGKGTIVIDLVPDKKTVSRSTPLHIGVEVGSEEKDGAKSMGTDSIEVPVFKSRSDG